MATKQAKQHQCPHCKAMFDRSFNLKRHIGTQHEEGNRSCLCDICGKTFVREDNMKAHRKSHLEKDGTISNPQPFSLNCDKCDKTFKARYNLKRHCREQHGVEAESFPCHTCDKTFYRLDHLKSHCKVHNKHLETCEGKSLSIGGALKGALDNVSLIP